MKESEVLQIIGQEISNQIIAGKSGDASLHSGGFVSADPCYIFGNDDRRFSESAARQQGEAYHGRVREWVEIEFEGLRAFFKTCSDGVGPLGHCVDAGWVAAIPLSACPARINDLFLTTK